MFKQLVCGLAVVCAASISSSVRGAEFDGTQPLICAAIDTAQCESDGSCLQGSAASINVPQFIRIRFDEMVVRAKRADGSERTSKIEGLQQNGGALILQGAENGLGWSLVVTQTEGHMTLTAAGDRLAFVVFGACTTD